MKSFRKLKKFFFTTAYYGDQLKQWPERGVLLNKWRAIIDRYRYWLGWITVKIVENLFILLQMAGFTFVDHFSQQIRIRGVGKTFFFWNNPITFLCENFLVSLDFRLDKVFHVVCSIFLGNRFWAFVLFSGSERVFSICRFFWSWLEQMCGLGSKVKRFWYRFLFFKSL